MDPNMDMDTDLYDADGFFAGTDFLSRYDQAGAPAAHSADIGSSELSNLLNAADASKVSRARSPQQSVQGFEEAYPDKDQFNPTFLDDDSCDEADPNDHDFTGYSNNFQFDEAYLNNRQFTEDDLGGHQVNMVGLPSRPLVDATANTEETDTLDDQLPNIKRRKTKNTDSSYMGLAHEHAPSNTSAARASIASMSTDRSSRLSASTTRSSYLSTSTGRSSVASMTSPLAPPDQPGEEGAYKWKCFVCHMGEGDSRKAYVRKEGSMPGEQASAGTPGSTTKANPGRAPPKPKNSWNSQTLLKKHIREYHLILFQRTISTEYVCIFCSCGHVTKEHCVSRFPDKESLLEHVSLAHHEIPRKRVRHDHYCSPLDEDSYLDTLTRRDGSAMD